MRQFATHLSLALTLLAPAAVTAQTMPAAATNNVLRIYRETVKPGKGDAHDALENAWSTAMDAAKQTTPQLAIKAMSGAEESWYISAFPNWAEMEKSNQAYEASPAFAAINKRFSAQEPEFLSDGRGLILTLRPDLSYGGPGEMGTSRYLSVTRISVRPGHTAEFEANRKIQKAAHESTTGPDKFSVWQVASGAPAGTFYIFAARKSLGEIDRDAIYHTSSAYMAALGDSTARNKMTANTSAAVISTQSDLFAFAPQQSSPPAEWVKADPGYWKKKALAKKMP